MVLYNMSVTGVRVVEFGSNSYTCSRICEDSLTTDMTDMITFDIQ